MLQTDHLFVERFTAITHPEGRIGAVVPTALATGSGGQHLFRDLVAQKSLASLYDFDNTEKLFPGVDSRYKFCLLTSTGRGTSVPRAELAFLLSDPSTIDDSHRIFQLSSEEIALLNPNTRTLPVFRTRNDADLTMFVYRRLPVLWNEGTPAGNLWGIKFSRMFDMTDDSGLFRTREDLESEGWELEGNVFARGDERMLPLYEAKMVDFFNHRVADVVKSATAVTRQNQPRYLTEDELRDLERQALPLRWVPEKDAVSAGGVSGNKNTGVTSRLNEVSWERGWLYGWCDVTSSRNERTSIPALLPRVGVGHTFPLMLLRQPPELVAALCAVQSSLVFDYVSRQKISGIHMSLSIWKQLPVPAPDDLRPHLEFLVPRVLELVYTAHDMEPLAKDLGYDGPPFVWDEERRAAIRAELDAYVFHLYGLSRDDTEYVLETFQTDSGGLKNNEIARYGTYRTRDLVLASYDRTVPPGVAPQPRESVR